MRKQLDFLGKVVITALLLIVSIACLQKNDFPEGRVRLGFEAVFEDEEVVKPESRTVLEGGKRVHWKMTDKISVSGGEDASEFSVSELSEDGLSATFEGEIAPSNLYRAIYPSQKDVVWVDNLVSLTLPSVQHPVASTFEDGIAPAVATIRPGETAHFRNVGALIGIHVNNPDIRSIRIDGQVPMTGEADVEVSEQPVADPVNDKSANYVVLESGSEKGFDAYYTYYAVVYPGSHDGGLKITFTNIDGRTAVYTNPKPFVINRNGNVSITSIIIDDSRWENGSSEPEPGADVWNLVRSVDDLAPGDVIKIGCLEKNVAAVSYNSGNYLNSGVAVFDGDVMKCDNAMQFVLSISDYIGNGDRTYWTLMCDGKELGTSAVKSVTLGSSKQVKTAWSINIEPDGKANVSTGQGRLVFNANSPRFSNYDSKLTSAMLLVRLYKKGGSNKPSIGSRPAVTISAPVVTQLAPGKVKVEVSYTGATSNPDKIGLHYGTDKNHLDNYISIPNPPQATEGTVSTIFESLASNTEYHFSAYVKVYGNGDHALLNETFESSVTSFTTASGSTDPDIPGEDGQPALRGNGWLELPGASSQDGLIGTYFVNGSHNGDYRNYTYNYQKSTYTSLWIAYPLYSATISSGRKGNWDVAPGIPQNEQINIWSGSYGVNCDTGSDFYARGHQIPNADRNGNDEMQKQTFYAINSTPQIQNGFNAGIWMRLEQDVRSSVRDTVYVVTGASFKTVGGNEPVKMIKPQHDTKQCPVPNYYWKVLLKVKRHAGQITDAKAIGFWFEHKIYAKGEDCASYSCSVDNIEAKTGFNFFVNVPDTIAATAESNSSWTSFLSF